MLTHIQTIDQDYKRANIYLNDFQEYVLRCFKDGAHIIEWNYHALTQEEAVKEANLFLNKH